MSGWKRVAVGGFIGWFLFSLVGLVVLIAFATEIPLAVSDRAAQIVPWIGILCGCAVAWHTDTHELEQ